jgi:uncharacterized protein YjbI with pentapeptide repeats
MDLGGLELRGFPRTLHHARLNGVNVHGALLDGTNLNVADHEGVDLAQVNLAGAVLRSAALSGLVLTGRDLSTVSFHQARFRGGDFVGRCCACSHPSRGSEQGRPPGCRGSDLTGAVLRIAVIVGCDLSGAMLTRSGATGAEFIHCNLSGADLRSANLTNVCSRSARSVAPISAEPCPAVSRASPT